MIETRGENKSQKQQLECDSDYVAFQLRKSWTNTLLHMHTSLNHNANTTSVIVLNAQKSFQYGADPVIQHIQKPKLLNLGQLCLLQKIDQMLTK